MGDEDIVWDNSPQDADIQWDDAVATGDVESPSFGKIASKALGDSALGQGARVAGAMTGMGKPLPQQKGKSFLDPAIRATGVPFGIPYNTPVPSPAQIAETNPNLGAWSQTGQDVFMPFFNYYNEMMLNAPKAMMQNMGYQAPESSSPLTSMLNAGAGMAGMARNPILKGANPMQRLPELMMRGAAFGAARTPDEGGLWNPASRAMQAGLGAAIPAGMHVAMSALKKSPVMLQKLANLIMRSQVPARGRDVNRALGTNVPQFLTTEGVTGSNLDEMLGKVQPIIEQSSQQVRQALGQSGRTTDITALLRRLQDYANRLARDPNTNKAEINSVRNLAIDLTNRVRRVGGNASRVPVSEAWEMKMLIDAQKANSSWGSQSQSTYNALMGQLHFDAKQALTKAVPEAEALMSRQSNAIQARRSIEKQLESLDKSHGAFSIAAAGIRHSPSLYGAKLVFDGVTQDDYKKVAEGAALIGGDAIISNPKVATNLAKALSGSSREMQAFMMNKYPKLVQGIWRGIAKLQQGGAGKNPTMGQTPPPSAPPSGGGGQTPPPSGPRGPQGPAGLPQPPNFQSTAIGGVPATRGPRSMQSGDWMPALPEGDPQLGGPEARRAIEHTMEGRPAPRELGYQNFARLTGDAKRDAIIKSRAAKMNRKKAGNTLIGQRELEKGNRSVGAASTSSLEASPAVMAPPRNAEGLAPKSSEYTSVIRETAPNNEKILQDIDWGTMKSRNPLIERLQEFKDDGTPLGKHLNEQAKTLIKSLYQGEQDAGVTAREFIQSNAGVLDQKAGTHMSKGVASRSSEAPLSESKTIREGNPSVTDVGDKSVGAMEIKNLEIERKPIREFVKKQTGTDIDDASSIGKGGFSPTNTIAELNSNPEFQKKNVFEKIRIASEVERKPYENRYSGKDAIKQNLKQDAADVAGVDTVRGCQNNCVSCYANKLSCQTRIGHTVPVAAEITGKIPKGKVLRIGITGDPATDWEHSVKQIKSVIARSEGADSHSVVVVSKLQNLAGFDPSVIKNMQVSMDPLDPKQMKITMENLLRIKDVSPDANIVLRIRSFASKNKELSASLKEAVDFANKNKFPVLETKMRFTKEIAKILDADMSQYHDAGSVVKANKGFLKQNAKRYLECDPRLKGCKFCGNCAKTAKALYEFGEKK